MYSSLPITLVLLLAHAMLSSASIFPRTSHFVGSALSQAHRVALKNSAGLAHDLRIAFKAVLVAQPSEGVASHRVYCTTASSSSGANRNGSSTARPSGTAHPTRTSSVSAPGATASPSPWKLAESHVSANRTPSNVLSLVH